MKVREFIQECIENLDIDAEMDFYLACEGTFLKIVSINMNADIDDPQSKNRGGIVFIRKVKHEGD